ncbi:Reverse transcriptase (RNA-dependent DNA polymerase) [Rhizoctonia solani]|uniref:Reverse transcriptase (RNA-dependent DNA polymerase) n=1 Tax=Rhizoctonia solani TaxID=456999 RepID=A0A8H7INC7_9AGAM|nr:Reverse transcriptase (RNA-dependent DNA polymerase) [Rhizoctonia solani]
MLRNLISIDLKYYDLCFTITNIYLHGNTANETLNALVDAPADPSEAQIFCGDFNLHHPMWSLEGSQPTPFCQCGHSCGTPSPGRTIRAVIDLENRDKWIEAIERLIEDNPPPLIYNSKEDVELGAHVLLEAMSNATARSMKFVKVHKRRLRAPWWNDACSDAVANLEQALDAESRSSALGHLRSTIRAARRNFADLVQRGTPHPPATAGEGWQNRHTPDDQALMLKSVFFPAVAPPVDTSPLGIPCLSHATIKISLQTKSPQPFPARQINPTQGFSESVQCLPQIWVPPKVPPQRACGGHPKTQKAGHVLTQSLQTNIVAGNVIQVSGKIMAARITFEIGKYNILPYTQFGGRDNSSCVDGGLALCHDIYAAWSHGKYASLLTLDISGYFNNVNHSRLNYTIRRLGFSDYTCNWLASYFSDRTAQFRINNCITRKFDISNVGIPQGLPLSPVLSSLYSYPVLVSIPSSDSLSVRAYVDDFTILATSSSRLQNTHLLESAAEQAGAALHALGLEFELEKCELIHFAKSGQSLANNPQCLWCTRQAHTTLSLLPLPQYDGSVSSWTGNSIFKTIVRHPNPHIRSPALVSWALTETTRPTIGENTKRGSTLDPWSFPHVPISALGHLASIPRFTSHLQESRKTPPPVSPLFLLSRKYPNASPQSGEPMALDLKSTQDPEPRLAPPLSLHWPTYPIPSASASTRILRHRGTRPISGDQGSRPISHPSRLVKTERNTLTASLAWRPALRKTARLSASPMGRNETPPEKAKGIGPRFEVFDAEMIALAKAATCGIAKARALGAHHIVLFADNKAALSNISLLSNTHANTHLETSALPSTTSSLSNDRADALANEGGTKPPMHSHNRSITWSKAEATRNASLTWSHLWSSQPHSCFVSEHIRRNPSLSLHPFFKAFPYHRAIHARLIQVIMGHAFLGEYRERFRPDDDPSCPCGAPRQTLDHVLQACPSFNLARHTLREVSGPMLSSTLFGTTPDCELSPNSSTQRMHSNYELPPPRCLLPMAAPPHADPFSLCTYMLFPPFGCACYV